MIYLNGQPIEVTIFPDKTSQVWKIPEHFFSYKNEITWEFESESEFIHLAQLVALLKTYQKLFSYTYHICLTEGRTSK